VSLASAVIRWLKGPRQRDLLAKNRGRLAGVDVARADDSFPAPAPSQTRARPTTSIASITFANEMNAKRVE